MSVVVVVVSVVVVVVLTDLSVINLWITTRICVLVGIITAALVQQCKSWCVYVCV